ncbi:MAG: serine protease [Acidobacteriota bacterium]
MESNPREPSFQAAQLDDVMREATLALMAVADGHWFASGTATIIGPRLAVTAKHVVEDYEQRFGKCSVLAANVLEGGKEGALWSVSNCYSSPFTDIALLFLSPVKGSEKAENYEWAVCPMMNLEPPEVGSGVWGFGYPNSEVNHLSSENEEQPSPTMKIKWSDRPSITTGTVIEVYFVSRDISKMPFPGFQTDARFDGGMSGGPVFNENGELCGIIGSGYAPYEQGDRWASFVSSLWPLMALQLKVPIPGNEAIDTYLLADLANAKYIRTLNLNKVTIELNGDGSVNRVGFRK